MNNARTLLAIALPLLILSAGNAMAASAPAAICPPAEDLGAVGPLPHVAEALKPNGTLRVLAVGSATMFGPEAALQPGTVTSQALGRSPGPAVPPDDPKSPPAANDAAFPFQMSDALKAAIPGLTIELTLRGGRGMTAPDMLALIRAELGKAHFDLVLWQTGTVEAVRNTLPGEFSQVLADGVEAIDAADANLILVDPQFSRFLQTNANLDPYMEALQQTASMPGVLLFRRYDMMRNWASDGAIDLERTARGARRRTVETLHHCLGDELARLILAATGK